MFMFKICLYFMRIIIIVFKVYKLCGYMCLYVCVCAHARTRARYVRMCVYTLFVLNLWDEHFFKIHNFIFLVQYIHILIT